MKRESKVVSSSAPSAPSTTADRQAAVVLAGMLIYVVAIALANMVMP